MNRANPDPKLPHFPVNQDSLDNENHSDYGPNGNTTMDEHDNDKDGGNVDDPTMEAHIDLAKIACEYYITQSYQNILTYIYSVLCLSRSYCHQNWTTQLP